MGRIGRLWTEEEIAERIDEVARRLRDELAKGRSTEETILKKVEAAVAAVVWEQIKIQFGLLGEKGVERSDTQRESKGEKFDSKRLTENLVRVIKNGRAGAKAPTREPVLRTAEEQERIQERDFGEFRELEVPLLQRQQKEAERQREEAAAKTEEARRKDERARKEGEKKEAARKKEEEKAKKKAEKMEAPMKKEEKKARKN
jgi:hypothetical protein